MKKTFIVAELGVNHEGNIDKAKQLIDIVADCGGDAVKIQTFVPELVADKNTCLYEVLDKCKLNYDQHVELKNYAELNGLEFFSSPFDFPSVDLLVKLDVNIIKIPAGMVPNKPYLRKISQIGKRVILSTGMSLLDEVRQALDILYDGTDDVSILQCNTAYPTQPYDVNLLAMVKMRELFGCPTGLSDHTLLIETSVAAVALGADIIERHFTLDRNGYGPDQTASLEPNEFGAMVKAIRNVELALGDGVKRRNVSESAFFNRRIERE